METPSPHTVVTVLIWAAMAFIFYRGVRAQLRQHESKSFALNLTLFLVGVFGILGLGWHYLNGSGVNVGI